MMRGWSVLLLMLGSSWGQQGDPGPTPCPNVCRYIWDENARQWQGLITIIPPLVFSEVNVQVEMTTTFLPSSRGKDRLGVYGGNQELQNIANRVAQRTPQKIRFLISFARGPTPRISSVVINGKEFCPNSLSFPDTRGFISLSYKITTSAGNKVPPGDEFRVDTKSPSTDEPFMTRRPTTPRTTASNTHTTRPTPTIGKCGQQNLVSAGITPLILEGQEARRGEFPWHVAMYSTKRKGVMAYICGGSLISRRTVVTAAHCVKADHRTLTLILGRHDLSASREEGGQQVAASAVIIHEKFNETGALGHDIALVTLASAVKFDDQYVSPICLWPTTKVDIDDIVNKDGIVAGWGRGDDDRSAGILRMAPMPVVDSVTCLESDRRFFGKHIRKTNFCAGYKNGTSACDGDSGGGLVFPEKQSDGSVKWFLRGIVSASAPSSSTICNPYKYVLFTNVAAHAKWIRHNAEWN